MPRFSLLPALLAGTVLSLPLAAMAADATPDRLLNAGSEAEAGNWLMVHRTYDSNRYSPLNEITTDNVGNLKLAFAVPLGGSEATAFGPGAMEATPLAKDGFLYITDPWGTPYKIDATTGKKGTVVWKGETGIDKDPSAGWLAVSRGLALINNLVVVTLLDGRVVAFDDETGDVVWDQQVGVNGEGFTNTALAIGDKIVVGQSMGDFATRGFIAALDAKTGEEIWRFWNVPEPGKPGSETWLCDSTGNPDCWKTGGAASWVTGSYDPATNTTYWGTGNPTPMYDPEYRPGTNLYTNSSIALDMDTGELKWYFQYTPGDYMDYDEVGVQLLVDTKVDGEDRKVLAHFGRNGVFYTLDRTNGAFIAANPYVSNLNWTKGIDPKTGHPVEYDASAPLQTYAIGALRRGGETVTTCPNIQGGVNYWPTAYDPTTGLAYGAGIEGCTDIKVNQVPVADVKSGNIFIGGDTTNSGVHAGSVFAFDVATGQQKVKADRQYPNYSGVLLTPGLVWTGEMDGTVVALDSATLEEKWSLNVGGGFAAPPMSFAIDGKQYIAIASGTNPLSTFGFTDLSGKPPANVLYVFSL